MIIDTNGNLIDLLQERNDNLFKILDTHAEKLKAEYYINAERKKPLPLRLGHRFSQIIYMALADEPLMGMVDFTNINADVLQDYYQKYCELLCRYILFEVPSTRQLFCAFMRITVEKYLFLLEKTTDEQLKEYANYINDNLTGLIFSGAEMGNGDSKSILSRGKIKKEGQGMVENAFEGTLNFNEVTAPPEQLMAQVKKLLGR